MTTKVNEQKVSWWKLFKQAVSGKGQPDYTKGSIGQAAFLLAVPMVLEMALESVFAVTDIFWVSGLGAHAVSVVGLTEAVMTLLYAIAIGLSMGTTAMIARRIGEKNIVAANQVVAQAMWISAMLSVVIAVLGIIYAESILRLMGADEAVIKDGTLFTSIMLGGSATIVFLFINNAIFRGAGDASVAMRALWLANGINIVLDPLLIYGVGPFPEMGVTGAAVATTIGRGIGVIYQLYHLQSVKGRVRLALAYARPVWHLMKRLLVVSGGGILQFLIATASWVVLVRIVSLYGSEAVAGYTIGIRLIMFAILPAWGMSNAVATLVGQNLGAGHPDRAEQSVWTIARYNVSFMLLVAITFIALAEPIIRLFSSDPMVVQYGVDCLRYISYGYGFYAIGMIMVQAFNGAGDTVTPTKINFFCYWLFQLPLAYLLAQWMQLGPEGVFLSVMIAESVLALVGVWVFRKGHWKHQSI
ncbi:MATE family efflux transporter [Pleionea sp. CnH1-48]|uniref:MATE family efflux transporter n=1 Tax=Pleionea sp. CnH1-48 TaxID=2954494 RepID=UPI0020972803|nr:MATE family efflux transporter [Pleionea sp. CnH1-48]MCO7227189.1 MATE family efflux transporter [Pleionea sp. CnH1-48]